MATSKLLVHLRRSHLSSSLRTASHLVSNHNNLSPLSPHFSHNTHKPRSVWRENSTSFHSFYPRSFSTRPSDESQFSSDASTLSEFVNVGPSDVTEGVVGGSGEESSLPVRTLISILDGYHDLSGLPWWIIIVSSTLAMRIALYPILILQLKKLQKIAKFYPKLPPLFPPPLSGRSHFDQILFFRKERRAMGCPSYLWFLAYASIQVPSFFLWVTSIRRMSLNNHPGFECGGAFWFQNLTEVCHDTSGLIFPFLIAFLHNINVMISWSSSSVGKMTGMLGFAAKTFKTCLDFFTIPIFFVGLCVPQGSLVYWSTNSLLNVIQQLFIKSPAVRAKLGLLDKHAPAAPANYEEAGFPANTSFYPLTKQHKISVLNLSPRELHALSVKLLSKGNTERAIPLLRLALQKDPEYIWALIVLGQTILQKGLHAEATEYFERAISTLVFASRPTTYEDVDLLILASQWAGIACIRQGKKAEGIAHLERVANMKEPEKPSSKARYFDGLVVLASALFNEGKKAEAANYLRLATAFDSSYKNLLEQCENDEDNFGNDNLSCKRDH